MFNESSKDHLGVDQRLLMMDGDIAKLEGLFEKLEVVREKASGDAQGRDVEQSVDIEEAIQEIAAPLGRIQVECLIIADKDVTPHLTDEQKSEFIEKLDKVLEQCDKADIGLYSIKRLREIRQGLEAEQS